MPPGVAARFIGLGDAHFAQRSYAATQTSPPQLGKVCDRRMTVTGARQRVRWGNNAGSRDCGGPAVCCLVRVVDANEKPAK